MAPGRKVAIVAGGLLAVALWAAREGLASKSLPMAAPIVVRTSFVERYDTLHRNETLSHLFARHNVIGAEMVELLSVAEGLNPRRVRAGQTFRFRYPVDADRPNRVRVRVDADRLLRLQRDSSGWRAETIEVKWTVHREYVEGTVESSLYDALQALIPDSVLPRAQREQFVWDLADGVYGWVIDFTRDIYPGDRFGVVYERLTSQLGDVSFGRVLASTLSSRGAEYPAYLMEGDDARNEYYDADGESLRRAFKMYPVQYRYISSSFSRSRLHPVLKVRRPHLGVDYRAAAGTPIRATADGTVLRAGRWGGYGIVVTIRHAKGIETRYAHMRGLAPGIRAGVRVRQDQTIGYVGMTGLATAPHVHYEFIQGNRHIDPKAASRYGSGDPVPASRRAEFDRLLAYYDRLFAAFTAPTTRSVAGVDD